MWGLAIIIACSWPPLVELAGHRPKGHFFPASGILLSVDWYSLSMALSFSFCSLVRDGLSLFKCRLGVGN